MATSTADLSHSKQGAILPEVRKNRLVSCYKIPEVNALYFNHLNLSDERFFVIFCRIFLVCLPDPSIPRLRATAALSDSSLFLDRQGHGMSHARLSVVLIWNL